MIRLSLILGALAASTLHAAPLLDPPTAGERIALIGNGLGERFLEHPYFEANLHLRHPDARIIVRNLCRPGDTAGFRPHPSRKTQWAFSGAEKFHPDKQRHTGTGHHPSPDEWLSIVKADTIVAFFGYNESFAGPDGLENFKGEIDAFITHTLAQQYNGKSAPKLVLVSPIAFENLSANRDLPDGEAENANLALYTAAMRDVAAARKVPFLDLFGPTSAIYQKGAPPFTRNGFLPTDDGYRQLGKLLADALYGPSPVRGKGSPVKLLAAIVDKNWHWSSDYRMLNGVHVDGRRYKPFGPHNYPAETAKIRAMTEARDLAVWHAAQGKPFDLAAADRATPELPPVQTNYAPSNKNGTPDYLYGDKAVAAIKPAEGYKVELFASEKEYPNLANPVQLSFDDRGRLWVAVMPSYPHYKPGDPRPDDKLLIYEDTDGDGRANKETVFADMLHLPTGFELAPEGVYVSQQPHLMLLRDTDGDDRADSREVVLTGFDSHDTHHAFGAFCADGPGAIAMAEGLFLHSNIETPYGPVRGMDGGFFRFNPQRTQLDRMAQVPIPNPWGIAYDRWGQDFFLHTSGPALRWMMPSSIKTRYGEATPLTRDLVPKGKAVRPTAGLEIVSSRHFPDEVQGDLMLGNNIGFLGIRQHSIKDESTGYLTEFRHDLIQSSDPNFRPVDLEFAPDGSLYVVDWHNMLIGHMQHNARDPLRDHAHGRIYRITYPSRPLVKPAEIAGAPVATLLDNLKLPEYRSRYRSRRALRGLPADEVLPALKSWVAALDSADPQHEHHLLEALWTTWGLNRVDKQLLRRVLHSPDFRARAAAVRVLRHASHQVPEHGDLLMQAAADPHGRVRLEAMIAASWLDNALGKKIATAAASQPLDGWSERTAKTVIDRLNGAPAADEAEENPAPPPPAHLDEIAKQRFRAGHEIYFRDAHCATCHQPDGNGLDPAFPPLTKSEWVTGDPERLIKLTLHGLMGPIEVNGKPYAGQVPMTPFGGLLNDEEIASVLTYVRNQFGNQAPAIDPAQVKNVREATRGRTMFYQSTELLNEHPMEDAR